MTNVKDKNYEKLRDFDGWYKQFVKREVPDGEWKCKFWEQDWNCPTEKELPKEELKDFCSIFDYFMCSPNNEYYDKVLEKWIPIGSKSRLFDDIWTAKEEILNHKKDKNFERLFLYRLELIKSENKMKWKVRYATFPDVEHYKYDNAAKRYEIIANKGE